MRKIGKKFNAFASIILSMAMILALLPSAYSEAAAEEASNLTAAAENSLTGTGTEADPFQIGSAADMKTMRDYINATAKYKVENGKAVTVGDEEEAADTKLYADAYYVLTADIDLKEVCSAEKGGWAPIGKKAGSALSNKSNAFRGVFDGKGYTISNLSIDQGGSQSRLYRFGLFGDNYGTIQNLNVKDANLVNLGFDNGIIAAINYGTIQNCHTSGAIQGSFMTGGITGTNYGGTIQNCYSTARITCSSGAGCIYGTNSKYDGQEPVVSNCYYIDTQPGENREGVCEPVSEEEFKTGRIAWLLQKGQKEAVWEQKLGEGGDAYPKLHKNGDAEELVYQVTFMLGSLEVSSLYVNPKTMITAPKVEVPSEQGYTTGERWYREAGRSDEWNFAKDTVNSDTVLYSEKAPIDYTITLHLNGGTLTDPEGFTAKEGEEGTYTKTYTIESEAITLPIPQKEHHVFLGWTSDGEEVLKGSPETEVTIPKGSTGNRTFTAQFRDALAPTVTISIGEQTWSSLTVNPAFDLYFQSSPAVTVTAEDNLDENPEISYYVSTEEIAESRLGTVKWTPYKESFPLDPTGSHTNYIVYVKVTDDHGNVVYASTSGLVLDVTAPVISGIADGSISCNGAEFTVTEAYLDWVKVDDTVIEPSANGFYSLSRTGSHTVIAKDKAGNETKVEVTVSEHEKWYSVT